MQMMSPMSRRLRRSLAVIAIVFFGIAAPSLTFYASGYRFLSGNAAITAIGGISIISPEPGVSLYVDGTYVDSTSFFSRDLFAQNLTPGLHQVSVAKDGYSTWEKELEVLPHLVTQASALVTPSPVVWEGMTPPAASSTSSDKRLYDLASGLFSPTATSSYELPISTSTAFVSNDIAIWADGQNIIADWHGSEDNPSALFCSDTEGCGNRMFIPVGASIRSLEFYPDRSDSVIVAAGKNVLAVELDSRSVRVTRIIYRGVAPEARVSNSTVYIKDQGSIYETSSLR